jgi:hypothetical protein
MSDEQEISEALRAAAVAALNALAKGDQCPVCRGAITAKEQRGRCIYLEPCGHHYQGRLKTKRG